MSSEDVRVQAQMGFGGERVSIQGITFHGVSQALGFHNAMLTMRQCRFLDNVASLDVGGAIFTSGGSVLIEDCQFFRNRILGPVFGGVGNGGALGVGGDDVTIRRCWFEENEATGRGGAVYGATWRIDLEDCVFVRNRAYNGAAVTVIGDPKLVGCTFYGNETVWSQGAAIELDWWVTRRVERCLVVGTVNGYGVGCWGAADLHCFCFWNNERGNVAGGCSDLLREGNFHSDPMLCDPPRGDFHLQEGSPCLPGEPGGHACGLIGAFGLGCMPEPTTETTWGRIKVQFRTARPARNDE